MWQKVNIISQCEKKTWKKSQAILDKYLFRIGVRTWSGRISTEGLKDLKEKLLKVRTKNMSIIAKIITKSGDDKIIWKLGSQKDFSNEGFYCIKKSKRRRYYMPKTKKYDILLNATVLAACFHDFGKISTEFQNKLRGNLTDDLRHELISLYIFQEIYNQKTNNQKYNIKENFQKILETVKSNICNIKKCSSLEIFNTGDTIKDMISYLIVSHHKFPLFFNNEAIGERYINKENDIQVNFDYKDGIDNFLKSDYGTKLFALIDLYFDKIFEIKSEDISYSGLLSHGRISLTMADHYFSSLKKEKITNDTQEISFNYKKINDYGQHKGILFANTGKNKEDFQCLVQPLDCHLYNIALHAKKIFRNIYNLKQNLPSWDIIDKPENIKQPSLNNNKFDWQYYAHESVLNIKNKNNGFIGFMMAGTGSGKTLCNMILMSELEQDTRFTVALGLRSLTLQTGTEYKNILGEHNIAVNMGAEAILKIYNQDNKFKNIDTFIDDKSGSDINVDEHIFIDDCEYNDVPDIIKTYVKKDKYQYMIKPVLVTTIDSLMYTEKQPEMALRLMSSDLIIDEIDNYDLIDQGAIMRLVKLSASYGRKVIISSATLSPEIAEAMYLSYYEGYKEYCYLHDRENKINIGWFCEDNELNQILEIEKSDFKEKHKNFSSNMIEYIKSKPIKRRASILNMKEKKEKNDVFEVIYNGCKELHSKNNTQIPNTDNKLSVGLIRIPDVSTVAELSEYLANKEETNNIEHRVLCYHSNFPLIIRDTIEKWLDDACKRKDENKIFKNSIVQNLIQNNQGKDIMIIIVATPVEEVGRDHDFDWMINSLSSIQTLIQGAGRVLRHRDKNIGENHNIFITERPLSAFKSLWKNDLNVFNCGPVFKNPGIESKLDTVFEYNDKLNTTLVNNVINLEENNIIDSRYCLTNKDDNNWLLSQKEHTKTFKILLKNEIINPALPFRNRINISGYKSINGINQYSSEGYDNFPFRKNGKSLDFLKVAAYKWHVKNNRNIISNDFQDIQEISDINNDTKIRKKNLVEYDESEKFVKYKQKYFSNIDESLVKHFICSIKHSVYNNIQTIGDIEQLQNSGLVYSPYLGLYKRII